MNTMLWHNLSRRIDFTPDRCPFFLSSLQQCLHQNLLATRITTHCSRQSMESQRSSTISSQSKTIKSLLFLRGIRQRCTPHTSNLYQFIDTYRWTGFVDVPKITEAQHGIFDFASVLEDKDFAEAIDPSWIDLLWRISDLSATILECWEFGVLEPELSQLEDALGM
jgi:hypothetical protein